MIKRKCKQCGKEFILNDSEVKFFKDRNLELPKRCKSCRQENKKENDNIVKDTNLYSNNKNNNNNNNKNTNNNRKKRTFKNIIVAGLVLITLLIGKLFNIDINLQQFISNIESGQATISYEFRNEQLWEEHFKKHRNEFSYSSKEEYLKGANEVINSVSSKFKKESEDGDDIYYDEKKNEIVFMSPDGYIRTYFKPVDGLNYFNRQ